MSFGGGSKQQTATTLSEPWGPQQPHLTRTFGEAERLYNQGPQQFYPGQTYANFAPETEQALGMQASRASAGSPLLRSAQDVLKDTSAGVYLNSNPYVDRMFGSAADAVTRKYREATAPSIGSQFALSGRYGSGAHANALNQSQDQLGRSLGDLAANIYGGNYNQERQRQTQAAALAPSLAQADYADIGQLANVGAQRERLQEQQIGENVARYNFNQQAPFDALARYQQLVQGGYGGRQTQTQPLYRNYGASILGGGLLGSQIGATKGIDNPLLGTIAGGILGGLF
jgi:hypothetical protein